MVSYQRALGDYAFGSYRDFLSTITLNPSLGDFLDMVNNDKANATAGTSPNENYARESVMQLFALGLVQLDPTGVPPCGRRQHTARVRPDHGFRNGQSPHRLDLRGRRQGSRFALEEPALLFRTHGSVRGSSRRHSEESQLAGCVHDPCRWHGGSRPERGHRLSLQTSQSRPLCFLPFDPALHHQQPLARLRGTSRSRVPILAGQSSKRDHRHPH